MTEMKEQCCRRQLQRVINKLLTENRLIKTGWGTYQLKL